MGFEYPTVDHIYQNHTIDSTRWYGFIPREDDIVIATPYKSGTTWMQLIVLNLLLQDFEVRDLGQHTFWLDNRHSNLDERLEILDQQGHRRFIKTHLPLDGLPFYSQIKYVVVGRDPRDVCMSLWNHHSNYTAENLSNTNRTPGRIGHPLPRSPENFRDFWYQWITTGWFEWETEGYPYWSNMRHVQTWWNFRHLTNILFVHFNDLLSNLEGEIQRVADFLNIEVAPDMLPKIAHAVSFNTVKENAEKIRPGAGDTWKDGAQTFFHKGTNGRWRDVLTKEDLELYRAAVARELTPDCAHWLENGRNKTTHRTSDDARIRLNPPKG